MSMGIIGAAVITGVASYASAQKSRFRPQSFDISPVDQITSEIKQLNIDIPNFTPLELWTNMQEQVLSGIKKGLEEGGITFSDATTEQLKRQSLEDIAVKFPAKREHIAQQLAGTGNIGALGRGLIGIGTAQAQEESRALRGIDIKREEQRLNSYSNLIDQARTAVDPEAVKFVGALDSANLAADVGKFNIARQSEREQLNVDIAKFNKKLELDSKLGYQTGQISAMGQPTNLSSAGTALSEGTAAYLYGRQSQKDNSFIQQFLDNQKTKPKEGVK